MIEGTLTAQPETAPKPPRQPSQSLAAKRARRHRQRKRNGAIALPSGNEIPFSTVKMLEALGWIDQRHIRDAQEVAKAMRVIAGHVVMCEARKPEPDGKLIAVTLGAGDLAALMQARLLPALPPQVLEPPVVKAAFIKAVQLFLRLMQERSK